MEVLKKIPLNHIRKQEIDFLATSRFNTGWPSFIEQEMCKLLVMDRTTGWPADWQVSMYLNSLKFTSVGKKNDKTQLSIIIY